MPVPCILSKVFRYLDSSFLIVTLTPRSRSRTEESPWFLEGSRPCRRLWRAKLVTEGIGDEQPGHPMANHVGPAVVSLGVGAVSSCAPARTRLCFCNRLRFGPGASPGTKFKIITGVHCHARLSLLILPHPLFSVLLRPSRIVSSHSRVATRDTKRKKKKKKGACAQHRERKGGRVRRCGVCFDDYLLRKLYLFVFPFAGHPISSTCFVS